VPLLSSKRTDNMADISVFGLGYVGTVCAACLAHRGHRVIGVDKSTTKVNMIAAGCSPVVEMDVDSLIRLSVDAGRLSSTVNVNEAIEATDLSIVCVGTPSHPNGSLSLDDIATVSSQIGRAVRAKAKRHTIVVRSTVLPGTTRGPINKRISRAAANVPFGLAFNPEFLREGTAIEDFNDPPRTIVGALDDETASEVMSLYDELPGEKIVTNVEIAEMVKYVDNAWHALKVVFANEIGLVAKTLGLDSRQIMDIVVMDRRLNISPAYLKPGFAFGGSCLPKDLRALNSLSRKLEIVLPVVDHILDSNRLMIERGADWLLRYADKRIAFLGISFKPGTDDTRESPFVTLVERLIGRGRDVRIFDPHIRIDGIMGANRDHLLQTIPHIAGLMVSTADQVINWADTIVITANDAAYTNILAEVRPDQTVFDFAHLNGDGPDSVKPAGFLW
jgi:GDP-mannose 6-dehydrogenase